MYFFNILTKLTEQSATSDSRVLVPPSGKMLLTNGSGAIAGVSRVEVYEEWDGEIYTLVTPMGNVEFHEREADRIVGDVQFALVDNPFRG